MCGNTFQICVEILSRYVWKYFPDMCGNTLLGRATHKRFIVARDDTHNELPVIRFGPRCAKNEEKKLKKKTVGPPSEVFQITVPNILFLYRGQTNLILKMPILL